MKRNLVYIISLSVLTISYPVYLQAQMNSLNDFDQHSPKEKQSSLIKIEPEFNVYYMPSRGHGITVLDSSLRASYGDMIYAWIGRQAVLAIEEDPRRRFNTTATHYGISVAPIKIENEDLILKYEAYRPNRGMFESERGALFVPKAQVDNFKARYSYFDLQYSRSQIQSVPLVKLNKRIANVYGFGGHYELSISDQLKAKFKAMLFRENVIGTKKYKSTWKEMISANICYKPFRQLEFNLEALVFPTGIPFGGTQLDSMSVFTLTELSPAMDDFKKRFAGAIRGNITIKIPINDSKCF